MKVYFIFHALVILSVYLFISGCAVIDTAVLESAEPLKARKVKVVAYMGTGLDLNRMVFSPNLPSNEYNSPNGKAAAEIGVKMGLGLGKGFEVVLSSVASSGSFPNKASLKYLVRRDSTWALALMPGYYQYKGEGPMNYNWGYDNRPFTGTYKSTGFELPAVISVYAKSQRDVASFCVKLGANRLIYKRLDNTDESEDDVVVDEGDVTSLYGAVIVGFHLRAKYFVLRPEMGFYVYPIAQSGVSIKPVFNMGMGLEFQ